MVAIQSNDYLVGHIDTRPGGREENQDYFIASDTPLGQLVVVCDGMGGLRGGSIASRLACETIVDVFQKSDKNDKPESVLAKSVESANSAIIEYAANNGLTGMGTTLTATLVRKECAYVTHAGDSRIYLLRRHKKVFRSADHSIVAQMVRQGVITEEQARLSSESNIITNALGIREKAEFTISKIPYCKNDRFVMCSDGIWGAVPEPVLIDMIQKFRDSESAVENTVSSIDSIGFNNGGMHDNLTVAIFDMSISSETLKKKRKCLFAAVLACVTALCIATLLIVKIVSQPSSRKQDIVETDGQTEVAAQTDSCKTAKADSSGLVVSSPSADNN